MSGSFTLEGLLLDPCLAGFSLRPGAAGSVPQPSWVLEVSRPGEAAEARPGDIVVAGKPDDGNALRLLGEDLSACGACALALPGEPPEEPGGLALVSYPAWMPRHAAAGLLARALWPFARADYIGSFGEAFFPGRRAAPDPGFPEGVALRVLSVHPEPAGRRGSGGAGDISGMLERCLPLGTDIRLLPAGPAGGGCLVLRAAGSVGTAEIRASLREAVQGRGVTIGVSEAFPVSGRPLEFAPKAKEAAVLGMALFGAGHVAFYENLYLYEAFIDDGRPELLLTFSRDTLNRLRDWDACHGSELLTTLETYFELDRNVRRTAERLGIHRHTLRQRLERIEEATSCPVRGEGAMRYELILAYKHLSKIKL